MYLSVVEKFDIRWEQKYLNLILDISFVIRLLSIENITKLW